VLRQFTVTELLFCPNRIKTQSIEYSVKSAKTVLPSVASGFVFEELLTLITINEDNSPQPELISDSALFDPDTFQLFPKSNPATFPSTNEMSYLAILDSARDLRTIKLIFDAQKRDFNSITGISNRVTFTPPTLIGSFVGKLAPPTSPSRIEPDTTYSLKFSPFAQPEVSSPTSTQINQFKHLRYSFAEIDISPIITPLPNTSTSDLSFSLSINIKSYVDPSPSYHAGDTNQTLFDALKGSGSANQVLAMLRSIGLLEAIVERMLFHLNNTFTADFTVAEKNHITNQIRASWLPPESDILGATAIFCVDEVLPNWLNLANNVTLADFYTLRKWI